MEDAAQGCPLGPGVHQGLLPRVPDVEQLLQDSTTGLKCLISLNAKHACALQAGVYVGRLDISRLRAQVLTHTTAVRLCHPRDMLPCTCLTSAPCLHVSLSLGNSEPIKNAQLGVHALEGAVPMRPGWISPANLTPGMWRLVAKMPLNSQIALAALGK